jgi:tetratricopeptide (TPR) repeat protein
VLDRKPQTSPYLGVRLIRSSNSFRRQYEQTGPIYDVDVVVGFSKLVLTDLARRTSNLENTTLNGSTENLNCAIEMLNTVVDTTQDRSDGLIALANMLSARFDRTGFMDDLNRAIEMLNTVVDTIQDRPDGLIALTSMLGTRFGRTGFMDDLNRAIEVADMAVDATRDNIDRACHLIDLGTWLCNRFEWTGSMDDLNRAVEVVEMALNVIPEDHHDRASCLDTLGICLGKRFERTGSMDDLNRAVELFDMALNTTPHEHSSRPATLNNLGYFLNTRFEQTGSLDNLNRAVDVADMAVKATPQNHPNRSGYLSNLGNWLGRRFERIGLMDDLNRAVEIADIAVNATPYNHPTRPMYLNTLANWLGTRFKRAGSIDDLHRAIEVADIAVNVTPDNHTLRAAYLNNLGNWLGTRFERTGSIEDLDRAVNIAEMAVNTTPHDHPGRTICLNHLSIRLNTRFRRTGLINDINRAVEVADIVVNATPYDHPDRPGRLSNLGLRLRTRFDRTRSIEDLNRGVEAADMAVNAIPKDHPDKAAYFSNLGLLLSTRSTQTGLIDDLSRAVEVIDIAVEATPRDHPDRAARLDSLGHCVYMRFGRTGSTDDINRALSCYKEAWACHTSPPSIRIASAARAANILGSQLRWEEASSLLEGAMELLPMVSARSLQNSDKQYALANFSGLASMAAAVCLEAGRGEHRALQLLELGRCVIAGLLLEMRTDISDLEEQRPILAAEFASLRNELDARPTEVTLPSDTASSWKSQATRRSKAEEEFNKLIEKIRGQPGFENFLLPPTREELMAAAGQGSIVIINVSFRRCDAFLIEHHQIRVLPLPKLNEEELDKRIQQQSVGSVSTLEWLWTVAVGPILDALGCQHSPSDGKWPHVWWIPTRALSHFPIHAAGFHTRGSAETVLDSVISSYASSVKALIYGRRHSLPRPARLGSGPEQALLVAMEKTPSLPGSSALPFATKEVEIVTDLCLSLQLKAVVPPRRKEEVLTHLRACRVFHFAGHGRSDPLDPSRSCLLLDDWKESLLTVEDLRDSSIQECSPFLGYLSACSTSANKVNELVDEGIHLASAFQLAGFRHVIGTLWEVSDSHCVDVARVVYETIRDEGMTDMAVCRGLHRAIKELRDAQVQSTRVARDAELIDEEGCDGGCQDRLQGPLHWVPYIHFGV